ncbi:MAG: EamA family transporter, partial [Mesorhizobium amorphae]
MTSPSPALSLTPSAQAGQGTGILLVFLSAVVWSGGGTIALFLQDASGWTAVFWRSLWAASFLLGFMVWRDGVGGTLALFRNMGLPGLAVAVCFAIAGSTFVIAIGYTTIANIVLMQAGVPLLAALLGFILFRERVRGTTWIAIAAVIAGVAV